MRRFAWLALLTGVPTLGAAQGFGLYELGTCGMGRAGVAAANPCPDGSAIFFNPAGLAGLAGNHLSGGLTAVQAQGSFTDDRRAFTNRLNNPMIPVPNLYFTHALTPEATVGLGVYAPYGLETHWPTNFDGRFLGYTSKIRSIYVQPTLAYQLHERLKVGVGVAYIHSNIELNQRVDLSTQVVPSALVPPGTTFYQLGIKFGTDIADAQLKASGNGYAVNVGAILKVTDRLSIGGHWLTRKTIGFDGDAVFTQVATNNLVLPLGHQINLPPACTPAAPCALDNLVSALFANPFGPFIDGGVHTEITLPSQGSLGFSYKVSDAWSVMADYQYVVWGWFYELPVNFDNPGTPDFVLYEGYKDTHGFRFGAEYRPSGDFIIRAGALHHGAAAPPETVTPLLPEGVRNEVTAGFTGRISRTLRTDFAYQFIKQNDRRGRIHDATVGNTGVYKFSGHLVAFGLSLTF
jgi:long-chain fatty acid transport protein